MLARKRLSHGLIMAGVLFGTVLDQAAAKPPTPPDASPPGWMNESFALFTNWAFADSSGSQLLSLTQQGDDDVKKAMSLATKALCSSGILPIKLLRHQTASKDYTNRDTAHQFAKRAGFLFSIQGGHVPEDSVCLLLPPQLHNDLAFVKGDAVAANKQAGNKLLQKIAKKVGRPVANATAIATVGKNTLWAVNFKREGDHKSAGFFLDPVGAWFDGYAVSCKPNYCDSFRVDGPDEISAREFKLIGAITWRGHEMFFIAWHGQEGQSLTGFAIEGGRIVALSRQEGTTTNSSLGYRYWAPL